MISDTSSSLKVRKVHIPLSDALQTVTGSEREALCSNGRQNLQAFPYLTCPASETWTVLDSGQNRAYELIHTLNSTQKLHKLLNFPANYELYRTFRASNWTGERRDFHLLMEVQKNAVRKMKPCVERWRADTLPPPSLLEFQRLCNATPLQVCFFTPSSSADISSHPSCAMINLHSSKFELTHISSDDFCALHPEPVASFFVFCADRNMGPVLQFQTRGKNVK